MAEITPLKVQITPHREFLVANSPEQKLFVMLKLRPQGEVASTRPSTAVSLLIDTSGSMYEVVGGNAEPTGNFITTDGKKYREVVGGKTKIDLVIESLYSLVDSGKLNENDRLCLIQFDDRASTLIGLTPATEKTRLKEAIATLHNYSGGTCLGRGMEQALELLGSQTMTSRRALVFTDGETFDEVECKELAQKFASYGIPITALGIGDYNEDLLVDLSDTTGGRLYHVVSEEATGRQVSIAELPKTIFEEYVQAQQEVINNLALQIKTVKGVTLSLG